MILGSPQLLHHFQKSTLQKLEELLIETSLWDPFDIGRVELKQGIIRTSYVFLMYLYEPYLSFNNSTKMDKYLGSLYHLSINTLLNYIESSMWQKELMQLLIEEDLVDFVVMVPWFVPSCSQERAHEVVHQLTKVQSLQPPSLINICKAKVAKLKIGLISDTDKVKSFFQISSELF